MPPCFCTSMDTGPRARSGYDLVMTEVIGDGVHHFVVEAKLRHRYGSAHVSRGGVGQRRRDRNGGTDGERGRGKMGRSGSRRPASNRLLYAAADDPYWEEIAARCLTCANCTMVCPACLCSTVEDPGTSQWKR